MKKIIFSVFILTLLSFNAISSDNRDMNLNIVTNDGVALIPMFTDFTAITLERFSNEISLNNNCNITLFFCIKGEGSGKNIMIFSGGNCSGIPIATVITDDKGCASYTFTTGCNLTYSARVACEEAPGQCTYFVPVNIGNKGTINMFKCP
jgi:hypothetical protein